MLVVDASLAVELALDRVGEHASADLDRGGRLIAPPLLWSEVPSALHEMSFRDEISDALAELALQRFLSGRLSINEHRPDGHAAAAWAVAEELRRGASRLGFVVTPDEL
jgi:predicted nucleic acid-binding protein